MAITFEFSELGLSQKEILDLFLLFNITIEKVDPKLNLNPDKLLEEEKVRWDQACSTLENCLKPFAIASAKEYATMFLGQKVFTRGVDFKEYRLFLILAKVFNSSIPVETQVSRLFKTTISESRSLIRNVMAKYQDQLNPEIHEILKKIIQSSLQKGKEGNVFSAIIYSSTLVEQLNRILIGINADLPEITKKAGTVSMYEIKEDSFKELLDYFKIPYKGGKKGSKRGAK